ncbi:MAG TPA: rhomboid family intramembrane serine protease [Nitrospirae bacterium]|nr:rhomboid family intramembrane serine protease [Nitrospirota bacterium]HDZ00789.1 rhomboid family intramembrane serine protease [Nitrospirota bacterium]
MIPFKDDNPTLRFPFITIALIAVNTAIFILQMLSPADPGKIAFAFGAIPHYLLTFKTVQPVHPVLTVFTSMFMHGGVLHLSTNMLFLWIFGNNIEDKLGYGRFIVFYLLCGFVAAYSHAITNPVSTMPMIGASGAVSGILGAYMLLFPRARVHTLIFLGFFVQVVRLPAVLVIGFWIVIQFINGILSRGTAGHGGVAWFAHIGGFVFGILMIKIFMKRRKRVYY